MTRPIAISQRNPRYWEYEGEPTLLLGGSSEDNLFQVPDFEEDLEKLTAAGGNYVRCTMSSREEFAVWPFEAVGDGLYDLDAWNDEYWDRFERFLEATHERDVVVQLEMWAQFDCYVVDHEPDIEEASWRANPFNPANNRNYESEESELLAHTPSSNPAYVDNAFFWSVPELGDLEEVLGYQQRFVDEVLSYALEYPHVLYCVDNETHTDQRWGEYWADYIRQRAHRRGRTVEVTQMYWMPDVRHPKQAFVADHPETYTYWDVSQDVDNALEARERLDPVRPLNNVKIYGGDDGPDWAGDDEVGVDRFWTAVFSGVAATRFHRPATGLGITDLAAHHIEAAREVTGLFDLFACEPRPDLLSDADDAYLLADPGDEYAVCFLDGGAATVDVTGVDACRWYDVEAKGVAATESVDGTSARLETPGDGRWVAVLS